jgi:hypothetical protein
MTIQMKEGPDLASSTLVEADAFSPPKSPLVMPKQALTSGQGALRGAIAFIAARLTPGRSGMRRAG